jgi:hypothetical protein
MWRKPVPGFESDTEVTDCVNMMAFLFNPTI